MGRAESGVLSIQSSKVVHGIVYEPPTDTPKRYRVEDVL
jgi:hypothetical protein